MAPQQTAQIGSGRQRSRAAAPGAISPARRFTAPISKQIVSFIRQHETAT